MNIRRLYIEKKEGCDVEAKGLLADIRENLGIQGVTNVRLFIRYDVEGIEDAVYEAAKTTIFSKPVFSFVLSPHFPFRSASSFFIISF